MEDIDEPLDDEDIEYDESRDIFIYGVDGESYFADGCWWLPILSFGGDSDIPVYGGTIACPTAEAVEAIKAYFRCNIYPLGPEDVKELFKEARLKYLRSALH